MRALLFAALIGVVSAVFVQKLTWRESFKTRMIREGKWAAYKKQRDERVALLRARGDPQIEDVKDYSDLEYTALITVGTPQQEFSVVFDTGSPVFWLTSPKCSDEECQQKRQFVSSQSSTYIATNETFDLGYGTGQSGGRWAIDTVAIGPKGGNQLVFPNTIFGLAAELDPTFLDAAYMDGLFGLSFPFQPRIPHDPVLIAAMKNGLFDPPIITTFFEKRGQQDGAPGGEITFGGLDEKNCGPVIAYQPLSQANYFQFEIDQLQVGDLKIERKIQVIADTGTSSVYAVPEILQQIVKALNAELNSDDGTYYVNCDQDVGIDLTIGGLVYTINSTNMIREGQWNGKCMLDVAEDARLSRFSGVEINLGGPLQRQYCVVYDLGEKRIGFAKPLHN